MENKIIHYALGYGGNLNYNCICGKEIHSHSKEESARIDLSLVDCPDCLENKIYLQDLAEVNSSDFKRRIYIESDILSSTELRSAQRDVRNIIGDKSTASRRVFNEILDFAWHNLEKTWVAVKKADEIYATSSLMPLCGNSYMGAPVIFNGMCERAVKENITGKDIYILNSLEYINWYMIDIPLMKKAFEKNNLFMYDDKYEMSKIDVTNINPSN